MNIMRFGFVIAALGLMAVGCSDEEKPLEPLEIVGEYVDNFDMDQSITEDSWNGARIADYDNDENVVYTQLPEDDMFNPSKFAKTVYTQPKDDAFYFCMVVFDADTLSDAKASSASADDSNPAESGCGGEFPWSLATKK